jgi:DeoR family fructose operon transcriptional repressor
MLAEERLRTILGIIEDREVVSVPELSGRLGTSEVTVRRDLRELEDMGKLRRTRGGAMRAEQYAGTYYEPRFTQLDKTNLSLKEQIARKAYGQIQDNTAVIIDSSSTAKQLCAQLRARPKRGLMVVTNSVRVALDLANCDTVEVVLAGGQLRKNILSCTGSLTELVLGRLKVDKAFIGINGIDFLEGVLTTPNLSESAVKRQMRGCARETVILADHTKIGRTYLSKVFDIGEVDMIITDGGVDPAVSAQARDCGAELVVAED